MRMSIRQRLNKLEQQLSVEASEIDPRNGAEIVSEKGLMLREDRAYFAKPDVKLMRIGVREYLEAAERVYDAIGASYTCPERMPGTPEEFERECDRMTSSL